MLKFNEKAFDALRTFNYDSADLEQVIAVLRQTSDEARIAKLNHNCVVADLPFGWDYTYGYGDDAEQVKVITFPMIKISTGFRFYLDVEESGQIYISEGKDTRRTAIKRSTLNDFSRHTQKMIASVLESIVGGEAESDLFDLYKKFIQPDYTIIKGNQDPLKHYSFGIFETDIEDSSYGFLKATPVVAIGREHDGHRHIDVLHSGDCFSYEYIANADFGKYVIIKTSDGWIIDEDDFEDDDKKYIESALKVLNETWLDSDKAYFIQDDLICQKWSEIDIRPEIFVEHKDKDYVYYNDVVDIELNPQPDPDDIAFVMGGSDNVRFKRSYSVNDDEGIED